MMENTYDHFSFNSEKETSLEIFPETLNDIEDPNRFISIYSVTETDLNKNQVKNFQEDKNSNLNSENLLENLPSKVKADLDSFVIFCKRDWKKISRKLDRTHNIKIDPFQLRMHFTSHGKARLPKFLFNDEQDRLIVKAYEEIGNNWVQISKKYFNDLCPMRLRNRFYTLKKEHPQLRARRAKRKVVIRMEEGDEMKFVDMRTLVSEIEYEPSPSWLTFIESLIN